MESKKLSMQVVQNISTTNFFDNIPVNFLCSIFLPFLFHISILFLNQF